jgi:metal-responsive CopG/Arc/MetJ family transcriptional regulator
MRKFSMNLPEDLHKRLKHWCVDNDMEMGELIRRLLEEFLPTEEQEQGS